MRDRAPLGVLCCALVGCGAASPAPAPAARPGHRVLVVQGDADASGGDPATSGGYRGVDAVRAVPAPAARQRDPSRHQADVERVRRLYRDLAFADALSAATEARAAIATRVVDETDALALYRLAIYQGMSELALGHGEAAREAFRAAATLRPDATLPTEEFPPDVRELFEAERSALAAAAPVAWRPRVRPSDATLALDGRAVGAASAPLETPPGAHYLHVSAPLHAPQTLAVELTAGAADPEIALARLAGDELLRALDPAGVGQLDLRDRARLLRELGATSLLLATPSEGEWRGVSLESDGTLRTAREPELSALVASLVPPPPDETARPTPTESVWESPWLWGIASAVVVAVAASVLIGIAVQPTGHELVLSSSGR